MKRILLAMAATLLLGGCGDPDFAGAPDVRGLNLADANQALQQEGFNSTIVENDGLFGVVIEENFVVCDQEDTRGQLVPVRVAKRGC